VVSEQCLRGAACDRSIDAGGIDAAKQGCDQEAEVLEPFAERRHLEVEAGDAGQEVGAEGAAGDQRLEIAVGGGDQADVDGALLAAEQLALHQVGAIAPQLTATKLPARPSTRSSRACVLDIRRSGR
jgi:hypothetical protein